MTPRITLTRRQREPIYGQLRRHLTTIDDIRVFAEDDPEEAGRLALQYADDATGDSAVDGTAWTMEDDDLVMESAVLQRVPDVHPARLSVDELIREIAGEAADFGNRDAIERAVRDLSDVGLLHHRDEFVNPTRAALRFQELLDR